MQPGQTCSPRLMRSRFSARPRSRAYDTKRAFPGAEGRLWNLTWPRLGSNAMLKQRTVKQETPSTQAQDEPESESDNTTESAQATPQTRNIPCRIH
ncbi:hypothetical protein BDV06DRAFT_35160 [Aspergillus oleicola]